jgi:uncharacterized protein (TIGR02996 family)
VLRRYELGDKFWSVDVRDDDVVRIVWGTVGRLPQRRDKKFPDSAAAVSYAYWQTEKQLASGFVEIAAPPEPAPAEAPAEPPVARSIRFEMAAETKTDYRRYPKPAQFLEVEQRDRLLIEWEGELDHPDDPEKAPRRETTFETIAEASEAYDEAVQSAREDGDWRQVRSSTLQPAKIHPELEAQCWASPDDPAPWVVYADWLMAEGDPLGALAATPGDVEAGAQFAVQLSELGVEPAHVAIVRRHGFPRVAEIKIHEIDETDPTVLAEIARAVRTISPGRFIDSLRFGLAGYTDRNDWAPTLRALAETPHASKIRELRFDHYEYTDCEISWAPFGDFTGLLAAFPALEVLHLKSGAGGTLGELDLPSLRTLIRESGGLASVEVKAICDASWPRLEHLEIWFGSSNYGADTTIANIRPILEGTHFPQLRHLGIVNCEFVEDAIEALAHSAILPRLSSLDLSKGILARRGVALLEEHARAFRHLASLDLSRNLLEAEHCDRVRAVLDNVILTDQREIDHDDYEEEEQAEGALVRYVAVGE